MLRATDSRGGSHHADGAAPSLLIEIYKNLLF